MKLKDYVRLLSALPQDAEVDIHHDGKHLLDVTYTPFYTQEQRLVNGEIQEVDVAYVAHVSIKS